GSLARTQAVTTKDVQRVAAKYLDPGQRVVVWSVPKKPAAQAPLNGGSETRAGLRPAAKRGGAGEAAAGEFSLKRTQRVELPNGLTLLLYETHRLPIVVAEAYVRHVGLLEPEEKAGVGTLVARMLQEGTKEHSGPQIAEMI